MNIYSCIDNKNINKIFVLFYSCYLNCSNKNEIKFFLLIEKEQDDIKIPSFLENKIFIKSLQSLNLKKWKTIISQFQKHFYIQGHKCNNIMNFARFFIFKAFPEIDRVVYLDWDMIVHKDIFLLKDVYSSKKLVAARSQNVSFSTICGNIANLDKTNFHILNAKKIIDSSIFKIDYNKIKKNIISKYDNLIYKVTKIKNASKNESFNAGFYIVSKETFDENKLFTMILKLVEIQKEEKVFRFGTQIIMNLLSINDLILVDSKWNNTPDINNFISHWNGFSSKPWESKDKIWTHYYDSLKSLDN